MTREEQSIVEDFKETLKPQLTYLQELLEIIVPCSKQDEDVFKVGSDMIDELLDDINHGNYNQLSASIDLEKVIETWAEVEPIVSDYQKYSSVNRIMNAILVENGVET